MIMTMIPCYQLRQGAIDNDHHHYVEEGADCYYDHYYTHIHMYIFPFIYSVWSYLLHFGVNCRYFLRVKAVRAIAGDATKLIFTTPTTADVCARLHLAEVFFVSYLRNL